MPRRQPADHQPPVHGGKDLIRRTVPVLCTPRSVPTARAPKSAAGSPLPETSPGIETDATVGEFEVVQKVAAHSRNRLKLMGNRHRAGTQRFCWQHHALECAGLFQFVVTQFFECMRARMRAQASSFVKPNGGALHREEGFGGEAKFSRAASPQWKRRSVVSSRTPFPLHLATGLAQRQTSAMRALVAILVAAALLFGVYHYYFKKMPTTRRRHCPDASHQPDWRAHRSLADCPG